MGKEPIFSFFQPLSAFPSPDQHYWSVYARYVLDKKMTSYENKKSMIMQELNLQKYLDYEDGSIRKCRGKLFVSPFYQNAWLKAGEDISYNLDDPLNKLVEFIKSQKEHCNVYSIYHQRFYPHQIDIFFREPFSILLMGDESDIEINIPYIEGKPPADKNHLLIDVQKANERLSSAKAIIARRATRSMDILTGISLLQDLIASYDKRSLLRIPLPNIDHISELYYDRHISIQDVHNAVELLASGNLFDFMDYF